MTRVSRYNTATEAPITASKVPLHSPIAELSHGINNSVFYFLPIWLVFSNPVTNDRHHENVKKLRETLERLLRKHLDEKNEFKFWCEARLGRLAWRASEVDLHKRIKLSDVSKHYDKEFYTR